MPKSHDILISPGFGAGWSTWCSDRAEARFALTYQPIIAYLKLGGSHSGPVWTALLAQFEADFAAKFGPASHFYMGGADGLCVETVTGRFTIHEYDGSESLETEDDVREYWYDLDKEP